MQKEKILRLNSRFKNNEISKIKYELYKKVIGKITPVTFL